MNTAKDEQLFCKRLKELAHTAYHRGICTYTDFLNLNELNIYYRIKNELPNLSTELFGGYEGAERKIICFYEENMKPMIRMPIRCIKIMPVERKFSDALTHRDFLGAVLSLGIERQKAGDILTDDNTAYLFCNSVIADYIMDNLFRIKHTSVSCSEVFDYEETIKPHYIEVMGTVSSVRLDAVLAVAFQSSRSSLTGLIEGGKVYINSRLVESNSYALKEGDIVSVRGYGKFIYKNITKQTKKGRYSILLLKYN